MTQGLIENNVITLIDGEGIAMSAESSNMVLKGNQISDCRIDLCNKGTNNGFGDNTNEFTTGGLTTECLFA